MRCAAPSELLIRSVPGRRRPMGIDGVDRAANLASAGRDARDEVFAGFRQRDASRRAGETAHAEAASRPATALLKRSSDMPISGRRAAKAPAPRYRHHRLQLNQSDLCIVPVFEQVMSIHLYFQN